MKPIQTHGLILKQNQLHSEEFSVAGVAHVVLSGNPAKYWQVEMRINGSTDWMPFSGKIAKNITRYKVEGGKRMLFRVNLNGEKELEAWLCPVITETDRLLRRVLEKMEVSNQ